MSGVSKAAVALVALVGHGALAGLASAQPAFDPLSPEPRSDPRAEPRSRGGDPKIPVTLPPSAELPGGGVVSPTSLFAPPSVLSPLSLEHPVDPETYVCGPSDVFELDFWGSQNFQLKLTTDLEGRAFLARVGFVTVAGKTLAAVRTAMKSKVRALYPGLNFDLTLVSPRSFVVHVVDNVKQPGSYTSRALDRVSTVIR